MIYDTLSFLPQYVPPDLWRDLKPFIAQLRSDVPDGKIWIREPDIFALASKYKTRPLHEGRFEAHRRFIDIQMLLSGSEIIEVSSVDELLPETNFDEQNDIRFYKRNGIPPIRLTMLPGSFALFFPHDAHCPQLTPQTEALEVKKVVIKIDARLFVPLTV